MVPTAAQSALLTSGDSLSRETPPDKPLPPSPESLDKSSRKSPEQVSARLASFLSPFPSSFCAQLYVTVFVSQSWSTFLSRCTQYFFPFLSSNLCPF